MSRDYALRTCQYNVTAILHSNVACTLYSNVCHWHQWIITLVACNTSINKHYVMRSVTALVFFEISVRGWVTQCQFRMRISVTKNSSVVHSDRRNNEKICMTKGLIGCQHRSSGYWVNNTRGMNNSTNSSIDPVIRDVGYVEQHQCSWTVETWIYETQE